MSVIFRRCIDSYCLVRDRLCRSITGDIRIIDMRSNILAGFLPLRTKAANIAQSHCPAYCTAAAGRNTASYGYHYSVVLGSNINILGALNLTAFLRRILIDNSFRSVRTAVNGKITI